MRTYWQDSERLADLRRSLNIERALTSSGAGAILVQPEVDTIIANLVDYRNPLRQNVPRKPGSGQSWLLNRRSVPGTTVAQWAADTTEPVNDDGSYARVTFTYRTLIARGRISRQLQATGQSYADIMQMEMEARALDFRDQEDNAMLLGNNTGNANQPDGLCVLITAGQCVMTTTASGGEALTLDEIDNAIDLCRYNPDMIVCSKRTRRQISALLSANHMTVDKVEVNGGFKLLSYNGIPVYTSNNMVDIKTFNGQRVTLETGSNTSEMYTLDTEHFWVGELTPLTVQPLAKTTSQYDEFDIYEDVVFVIRDVASASKYIGLAP